MREAKINTSGVIYTEKHQCFAYADIITLITRSKKEPKEIFKKLEDAVGKVGLQVNEDKTKYLQTVEKQRSSFKVKAKN